MLAFQNSELKILAAFKILGFQNPKFKIFALLKILTLQNPVFKVFYDFKILAFQNPDRDRATALADRATAAADRADRATALTQKQKAQKADRATALTQKQKAQKILLPFVTQFQPSLPGLKNILMEKWHLIENQPLLREIFKEPPLISYRKGKSLKDMLVKAKL